MRKCPECSHPISEGDSQCPNCGALVNRPSLPTFSESKPFYPVAGKIGNRGEEFLAASKNGFRLCAVAGLSRHGKSEFMKSLAVRVPREYGGPPPDTREIEQMDRMVKSTDPGTYYGWRIRAAGQSFFFWDIAGEDFASLVSREGDVAWRPEPLLMEFLLNVLPLCRGILLCVALNLLWAPWQEEEGSKVAGDRAQSVAKRFDGDKERRSQADLDTSKAAYVRYLELAHYASLKHSQSGPTSIPASTDEISQALDKAVTSGRPLEVPVLVSFTMSDTYFRSGGLASPPTITSNDIPRRGELPSVPIYPDRDDPHAVARLFFPELLKHLETHVRWFKFDFSQAYQTGSLQKKPVARDSRGCFESFEFLMRMNWRSRWGSTKLLRRMQRLAYPSARNEEGVRTILHRADAPSIGRFV